MAANDRASLREKVLLGLGCVICGVWAVAVLVQTIAPSHKVPQEVHAIMLVLIPLLFGAAAWQSRRNGNGTTEET